jgi:hypothetical protein
VLGPNAVIEKVSIYAFAARWWYNAGGVALIGVHGSLGVPATPTGLTNQVQVAEWGNGAAKWVDLPPTLWDGWKTGAYRGLTFGRAPNLDNQYYGRFAAGVGQIQIQITYSS